MRKLHTAMALSTVLLGAALSMQFSSVPPTGRTGAVGQYCTGCHAGAALNTAGGGVSISGLPGTNYVPGQSYPFSVTISHGAANRFRWGFSIAAIGSGGADVGSFTSTNANAAPNGPELSHNGAVTTSAASTFTYDNLSWTAPATANQPVTFYYVGNAANGNGNSTGDFIYSGVTSIALPVALGRFTAAPVDNQVRLQWQTLSEQNSSHFTVQRSEDGQFYSGIGQVASVGQSQQTQQYRFTDAQLPYGGRSLFYRLAQTDKDGKTTLSQVLKVDLKPLKGQQVLQLMPTLVRPTMQVTARLQMTERTQILVHMSDAQGKVLATQQHWADAGQSNLSLRIPAHAAKGWLLLRFSNAQGLGQTMRVLVE